MSLSKDNEIKAEDINNLKAKVKAEMLNRCYTGSIASYGDANWDFTEVPATGVKIQEEHANKIVTPMDQIANQGYIHGTGSIAKAMNVLDSQMDIYISYGTVKETSTTGCSSSCTGLCLSCTSTCKGTCTSYCSQRCSNDCSGALCGGGVCGSCGYTCSSSCSSSCGVCGTMD